MFRLQIINSCFTGLLTVKTRPDELSDNYDISLLSLSLSLSCLPGIAISYVEQTGEHRVTQSDTCCQFLMNCFHRHPNTELHLEIITTTTTSNNNHTGKTDRQT